LGRLKKEHLDAFDAILVSIDGDKETVDFNRGTGTYDRCLAGCQSALEKTKFAASLSLSSWHFVDLLCHDWMIQDSEPRCERLCYGRQRYL
jgi:sulfatase maturation enzyme AslB (radical SAM superfamily)